MDDWNLTHQWLAEKLRAPQLWSIRDRDDITIQIEKKRTELYRTSETLQPLRDQRALVLAQLEAAMAAHLTSRGPWPELDVDLPELPT